MFNFKDLFVLDMANNHQGDVNHGLNIIREASEIVKKNNVRGAIKFQFRQLDSFIHKDFRKNPKEKHLIRFQSTEMSHKDYQNYMMRFLKINFIQYAHLLTKNQLI